MKNVIKKIKIRLFDAFKYISNDEGITLIEIMIVLAIIGILSLIVVPRLMDIPQKARVQAAKQQITAFSLALDRYYLDNGTYPTSEQGLDALVKMPTTEPSPMNYNEGGYLKKNEVPKDPWGRDYIYYSPSESGKEYEIISYGADGKEGGSGKNIDIKN